MNVLILAAGYATRLYPLTLNKAKPLLVVGGKPIIEWLADNLSGIPDLDTIYVVTNDKFAADFQAWSQGYRKGHPEFRFKIVNDGSTSDDDKLGAIGDINFVVTHENLSQTGLLIAAGDNLFTTPLADFVKEARNTEVTIAVFDVGDTEAIRSTATWSLMPKESSPGLRKNRKNPREHSLRSPFIITRPRCFRFCERIWLPAIMRISRAVLCSGSTPANR